MNPFQVASVIESELPDVCEELEHTSAFGDALQVMQVMVNYSKKMLLIHDLAKVLKCMRLVGKLYDRGNKTVKAAIESVYVFSFEGMQSVCNKIDWNIVRAKMPITLYTLYIKQLYSRAI